MECRIRAQLAGSRSAIVSSQLASQSINHPVSHVNLVNPWLCRSMGSIHGTWGQYPVSGPND